jgi:CspA family cold shock protein
MFENIDYQNREKSAMHISQKPTFINKTIFFRIYCKMVEGTVKFFNAMKHFGFITGNDGISYFVHESGLKEGVSITEGDKVSFDAVEGDRGPKAENVKKL